MPFIEDIVGLVESLLRFIVEMLKRFVEKDDVFAIFPISITMQDGGKRKRSNRSQASSSSKKNKNKRKEILNQEK